MKRLVITGVLLAACGGTTGSSTTADCATVTDTYASYGQAFFTTSCRTCHEHTNQFGTQAAVLASLTSIESEISSGKMPEGTSLSASEKARVLAWLSCGAP
jgi:hypothetical protein